MIAGRGIVLTSMEAVEENQTVFTHWTPKDNITTAIGFKIFFMITSLFDSKDTKQFNCYINL